MRRLLRPTNDYAAAAILPGDPGIALDLAQELIEGPLMSNHARGLWGYTGPAKSAEGELSVQSTGYGGQSAAAVLGQLAELGVRRAIRVGTCLALDGSPAGSWLIAEAAVGHDGEEQRPSAELSATLADTGPGGPGAALVASVDTVAAGAALEVGARAVDGATAGLFAAAAASGVSVAAGLVVVGSGPQELSDEQARQMLIELGHSAFLALARDGLGAQLDVGGVKRS